MTFIPSGAESNEEYHAHPHAWGSSMINTFLKSREKAWLMMNGELSFEQTPAMTIGSALHARFDGTFNDDYAVGPNVTSRRTKTWGEAVSTDPGKVWLLPKETWLIDKMEESIRANSQAAALIEDSDSEVGIRNDSPFGNYKVQCRMDLFKPDGHIADIKTTNDVDDFAKSVHSYGYHLQCCLYSWLHFLETGKWIPFLFIVVEKQAPYRSRVYQIDDDYLQYGFRAIRSALEEIGSCYESGDWSDPNYELLRAPTWMRSQLEAHHAP